MSDSSRPPKELMRIPAVAWPTVLLFFACLGGWIAVLWAVTTERLSYGWGFAWSTAAFFAMFTPVHEAAHQSISTTRWINEGIGRICGFLLLGLFGPFRYIHLEHHKHTNNPEKDPDYWSGRGPTWLLPLRWITQDLHYQVVYAKAWQRRPTGERVEAAITALAVLTTIGILISSGWLIDTLLLWLLPAKTAVSLLAYSFDYLPHKPHQITSATDRYRATLVRPNPLLTAVLLFQNLHLIHHLYPAVPFYRYTKIWNAQRAFLLEKGVQVRSITGKILTN